MTEPERPLKRKDQVALDEQIARELEAQMQPELLEEERKERQKQEEANIALIKSWENTQAMMEVDRLLAERLQAREREEMTDEDKAKLFVELVEKRKKTFCCIKSTRKEKQTSHQGTKENGTKDESSTKRAGDELEQEHSKKEKTDETEEVKSDDEAEVKKHMEIVKDDDIAIDAIPPASKPPMIIESKIIKEGIFGYFQLIRADGSSKR
ncbi:hypothetical protein Tco_0231294 [Tanacetum coccineum]